MTDEKLTQAHTLIVHTFIYVYWTNFIIKVSVTLS